MDEKPCRLPLVIGATGHRDLRDQDVPALERAVVDAIKRLKRDYLHDDPETPLVVLSSLAEGADRLIARVAMGLGAKLIAPLPMEPDEYRRDFEPGLKPDAAAEFDRMKGDALATPVMRFAPGNTRENVHEEARRALQYRAVGLFIVRHCHVLIALWNGDEQNTAVGGTSEVVKFKRDGISLDTAETARASLDAPEIGPVIHIETPRAKPGGGAKGVAVNPWGCEVVARHRGGWFRKSWRYVAAVLAELFGIKPDSDQETAELRAWETFAVQTAMTRQFNRAAAKLAFGADARQRLDRSLEYLFDAPADRSAGVAARLYAEQVLPRWCELYAIADTLALAWQRKFQRDWLVLFLLGLLAIVAFEIVTHVSPELNLLFVGYSVAFICVFIYLLYARYRQHQERYLDYRALAEALRVAVFWKLLGIGTSVQSARSPHASAVDLSSGESVADAYPIRQPRELDWVKTSLRALELLDETHAHALPNRRPEQDGYSCARDSWVSGQAKYFSGQGPAHDHRAGKLEIRSVALLLLSVVVALILFDLERRAHWHHGELGHDLVVLVVGLSGGLAAIFAGYAEKLALNAQARQYDRMRALFERAYELLPESVEGESFRRAQALFAELGAEAMKETAGWVEIYRQRPIRPP
jgi:hypothetical protein